MATTVSGSFHKADYNYTDESIAAAKTAFDTLRSSLANAGFSVNLSLSGGINYTPGSVQPPPADGEFAPKDEDAPTDSSEE